MTCVLQVNADWSCRGDSGDSLSFLLEPNPDGVYDSRYLVEGGNVTLDTLDTFAQEVPESSVEIQKVVPNCSSENLNVSATAFGVGSTRANLLVECI